MKWLEKYIHTTNEIEAIPVPIIADAAIASIGIGEGRLIPHLVLETKKRPDIEDLLKIHREVSIPGDVVVSWGKENKKSPNLRLFLQMKRPLELLMCLEFNVIKEGMIIDWIIRSNALYIQSGKLGDRVGDLVDEPKILLEIPHTGFEEIWDGIWQKALTKKFKLNGLNRKKAIEASIQSINKTRELYNFRMKDQQ